MANNVGAAGQTRLVEVLEEKVVLENVVEVMETAGKEDIAEQAEGHQEECQQAEPGQHGSRDIISQRAQKALEALQALQLELKPVNTRTRWAYSHLRRSLGKKHKAHLDRRSAAIQRIPKFWVKAISFSIFVEKLIYPRKCKIIFFFGCNSYFQNNVIIKEYSITITRCAVYYSTLYTGCKGYEHEADSHSHHDTSLNFFNWFTGHCPPGYTKVAEIIIEDLCLDPLKYYQKGEETSGESEENKESLQHLQRARTSGLQSRKLHNVCRHSQQRLKRNSSWD
ncbi:testis-specific Y-encoded protein 10-like [Rhynchocyon petersi]